MEVPPGCAIVVYTRMEGSSLKTKVRKKFGRRCSIRRYDMAPLFCDDGAVASNDRSFAYADGDLAFRLSACARSGCFTAIISRPRSRRPEIIAIIDHDEALSHVRRERMRREDAEWEAMAPPS